MTSRRCAPSCARFSGLGEGVTTRPVSPASAVAPLSDAPFHDSAVSPGFFPGPVSRPSFASTPTELNSSPTRCSHGFPFQVFLSSRRFPSNPCCRAICRFPVASRGAHNPVRRHFVKPPLRMPAFSHLPLLDDPPWPSLRPRSCRMCLRLSSTLGALPTALRSKPALSGNDSCLLRLTRSFFLGLVHPGCPPLPV